jgi:catechol 2,3-dioxygenase-like lactoylglutathione lyase family enzyme
MSASPKKVDMELSTVHLRRSHDWYCTALGFVPAGRCRQREVPGRGLVSGLPEADLDVWCLMGGLEWMQFEMIEFRKPRMRHMPSDWRPSDLGYSTIGLWVPHFDATLAQIRRTSGRLLTEPLGEMGDRRVCLRDPDGVLIELRERDVMPTPGYDGSRPVVRFVTLSVPDLGAARRFFCQGLGLEETKGLIHHPDDERLWGLAGAERRSLVIAAGSAVLELAEYQQPFPRSRPAGYLFSDQGILNIALGTADESVFGRTYERARGLGYRATSEPWSETGATVVYLTGPDGTSVELLHVSPAAMEEMGFVPTR